MNTWRARALAILRAVSNSAAADADYLLMHVTGVTRAQLLTRADHALSAAQQQLLESLLARRARGEPLAYLLQNQPFWSLDLQVTPDVLIPRADTETLVEWALELARARGQGALALADLGTGSGAIALALAHELPQAQVTATDISIAALDVARANAARLKLDVHFAQGAWCAALPARARFDLMVSNPPYIARDDAHLAALQFEPQLALTDGADGLSALTQIIHQARAHLVPGGWLLLEHGFDQAEAVRARLQQAGYAQVSTRADYGGNPRVSAGVFDG
ncbi:peptide chain release factor N(5)-glutamine methyltransferase [Sinimarinibacterium sp. NLF-5-8]|nr:peptide chain release factor N(5)-glutamine methyltransferase [Sinimarinibacterium sp. NLF-5-8]